MTTYEELLGKLYDFYADHKRGFTISNLYEDWIEKRGEQALDGNIDIKPVKRDDEHRLKYYAGEKLVTIPLKR